MELSRLFSAKNDHDFEQLALEIFDYQKTHCATYRDYVNSLNWPTPTCLKEIPFLPISFFKTHQVISKEKTPQLTFKSSGTGGQRSAHFVAETDLYIKAFTTIYSESIGNPTEQVILALLPNYLEQGDSSLVFMVDHLIKISNDSRSQFILNDLDQIASIYQDALKSGKKVVIFGVSYALLDLAEKSPNLSEAIIIETGGMKGRRTEMTKQELHQMLSEAFHGARISSEYGMTELLSQAYSLTNGRFKSNALLKVLIREMNDPFTYVDDGKTGGINVIDLANLHSCSFIATQDLGRIVENEFEIMGRFDQSDLRGCNLLVQ